MPKRFFRKGSAKNKRRRVYPKMSFKKRVLSVIKQQAEMKFAHTQIDTTLSNNINASNGVFSLEPPIPQGDHTYQRTGNSIRLHKVEIVGYLNWKPNPFSAEHTTGTSVYSANNIVRMNILKQRSHMSGHGIATNVPQSVFEWNNLLENSNAYLGTLENSLQDINRDAFINKKQIRMKMSGAVTKNGDIVSIDSSSDMLRKVKYVMRFGKAGKVISYRTAAQTHSTNFPYFLTQVAHNSYDGTPPIDLFSDLVVKWYYTDL